MGPSYPGATPAPGGLSPAPCDAFRRSTGLIPIDMSGPKDADVPSGGQLGAATALQVLRDPTPRLDLVPRHILRRDRPHSVAETLRRSVAPAAAALLVHVGFAVAFFYLLSFRDAEMPRDTAIPVEIVAEAPKAEGPKPDLPQRAGPQAGGGAAPSPPVAPQQARTLLAPTNLPAPPSDPPPPRSATKTDPAPPPPAEVVGPPKLVAPPPDAMRSATQDKENKAANLVPDDRQRDEATHEAKPVPVPQVLTTTEAAATVPVPVEPRTQRVDKPAPPIPAKVPSAADKLAAALPMDTSAMPLSFRAVLAGGGGQVKAIYGGLVQGRLAQAQPEIVDAAYAQRLKGNVSVTFTIDDTGNLGSLGIVQSSGDPRLDALALHWIQAAAPFPPPPPEAERTFRKALMFGN